MDQKKLTYWILGVVLLAGSGFALYHLATAKHEVGSGYKKAGSYLNGRVQSRNRAAGR